MHVLADARSAVVARDEFQSLGMPRVSRQWGVVVSSDQAVSKILVLGDVDASSVQDETFFIVPILDSLSD